MTISLTLTLVSALLAVDCATCLVVARLFDRERHVSGTRPSRGTPTPAARPHRKTCPQAT
jgi:hypothetical protein